MRRIPAREWLVPVDGPSLSLDPWGYRDYIRASSGEFTVARDLNVRLRSGWFSERSACYLAAGRPVVTQDTGFGTVLPTGEGLFAFRTLEDILEAFDVIDAITSARAELREPLPRSTLRPRRSFLSSFEILGTNRLDPGPPRCDRFRCGAS